MARRVFEQNRAVTVGATEFGVSYGSPRICSCANVAFGSVPAVQRGLTAVRRDAAVHEAEIGRLWTFALA